jgi:hypothetical protein
MRPIPGDIVSVLVRQNNNLIQVWGVVVSVDEDVDDAGGEGLTLLPCYSPWEMEATGIVFQRGAPMIVTNNIYVNCHMVVH